MKIGLGIFEFKKDDINHNLGKVVGALQAAHRHQVDLVLFGKDVLGTQSLSLDSVALFKIKQACIMFDVECGLGFIQNGISNYIVIDKSGEIVNHTNLQESSTFVYRDFSIWPVYLEITPKDWFNTELAVFRKEAQLIGDKVILVNSISNNAYGGGFYLEKNQLVVNQPMEQEGLSIFEVNL